MAVEDGADVVEPVRLEGTHRGGEDDALLEREGVTYAEIREPATVARQVEVRLDLLGALDVVRLGPNVAAEPVALVLHQRARRRGRTRDIGQRGREVARQVECELAEQQEAPQLVGDRIPFLAAGDEL